MSKQVEVGPVESFADGVLVPVDADGHSLIVARDGDQFFAALNRCPHMGFSLTRGPGGLKYDDGVVQCPWHNSRFELCTGKNLDWATGFAGRNVPKWSQRLVALGRTPSDLKTLSTRVDDGKVFVELPA